MSGWDKYRLPPRFRDVTPQHTGTIFAFIGARKPVTTVKAISEEMMKKQKADQQELATGKSSMYPSPKFEQALHYAVLIHAGQVRKETEIPYIAHLLGVASIALEYGASETEAIGALLHDAGEDAGGAGRIADIRQRFGEAVADIVQGCTDTEVVPKPEWRPRKEAYIAHLPEASRSVRLVSASDKLHNARAILRDYRVHGEKLWSRFNGGKDGTLWYYAALVEAFKIAEENELVAELGRVVSEIEELSKK
jgi:(p)ppGpp synthase/HD superfamily hydrolase